MLTRDHVTQWLKQLKDDGLHPSTREAIIFHVRAYLQWLDEHGRTTLAAHELIRRGDIPKLPTYLPRPLPPDADRALLARLEASACPYHQGLLLMRNTGLRIGELMALPYDCVRTDLNKNAFLKVPLGKLDNERLVPLDDKTAELIRRLQQTGRRKRTWLLETPSGTKTHRYLYYRALHQACSGLPIPDRMNSHRLRHTYATTLLNAGMSLVGVMKLLGHRSFRMTLRYAEITQETVGKEYRQALAQIEQRYDTRPRFTVENGTDPNKMLSDVARWIQKNVRDEQGPSARTLIKRIERLQAALGQITG